MDSVDLYWIPLGAGGHSVRFNGVVYEALVAARSRRPRFDLYHSALVVESGGARYTIESAPSPDDARAARGVVATGPVGDRRLGRWRLFRYEVRCWRGGVIPDLHLAVGGPVRVTTDSDIAERLLAVAPHVPAPVWGRDDLRTGDMWNSNSVVAWLLARSGVATDAITPPPNGRAPRLARGPRRRRPRAAIAGLG